MLTTSQFHLCYISSCPGTLGLIFLPFDTCIFHRLIWLLFYWMVWSFFFLINKSCAILFYCLILNNVLYSNYEYSDPDLSHFLTVVLAAYFKLFLSVVCGILVPWPGSNPCLLQWCLLTTWPPGKSWAVYFRWLHFKKNLYKGDNDFTFHWVA